VTRPSRRAFALAFAALCVTACTGSLFQSKAAPPTIYLLAAGLGSQPAAEPPGGVPPTTLPADLAVLKPRVRPGLESDRIAVLYPDRRLDYFADARWSGPLGEVLQDAAVQEFHARVRLRTVSADASVFASAYWLEIEVTDFQAEYTGAAGAPVVHVHFLARIGTSEDRRILGQFVAEAREPAAENRLAAIVDAYVRATDAALGQIAEGIGQTLGASEAR
jgi:cholesterol transport system auxiliary component